PGEIREKIDPGPEAELRGRDFCAGLRLSAVPPAKKRPRRPAGADVCSIILGLELKIGLGMGAHGANLRRGAAEVDVAAVAALPDVLAVLLEHLALLQVLQEGQVA